MSMPAPSSKGGGGGGHGEKKATRPQSSPQTKPPGVGADRPHWKVTIRRRTAFNESHQCKLNSQQIMTNTFHKERKQVHFKSYNLIQDAGDCYPTVVAGGVGGEAEIEHKMPLVKYMTGWSGNLADFVREGPRREVKIWPAPGPQVSTGEAGGGWEVGVASLPGFANTPESIHHSTVLNPSLCVPPHSSPR